MNRSLLPSPALDRLQQALSVTPKRMFGCIGVYSGTTFFAIIDGERVYFKVDELNRSTYEARGMGPFKPYGDTRPITSFHQVPPDVLAKPELLREWATAAIAAANRTKKR